MYLFDILSIKIADDEAQGEAEIKNDKNGWGDLALLCKCMHSPVKEGQEFFHSPFFLTKASRRSLILLNCLWAKADTSSS